MQTERTFEVHSRETADPGQAPLSRKAKATLARAIESRRNAIHAARAARHAPLRSARDIGVALLALGEQLEAGVITESTIEGAKRLEGDVERVFAHIQGQMSPRKKCEADTSAGSCHGAHNLSDEDLRVEPYLLQALDALGHVTPSLGVASDLDLLPDGYLSTVAGRLIAMGKGLVASGSTKHTMLRLDELEDRVRSRVSDDLAERIIGVLRAVHAVQDRWIPSSRLGELGISKQTVFAATPDGEGKAWKRGTRAAREYSVEWLLEYIAARWKPRS